MVIVLAGLAVLLVFVLAVVFASVKQIDDERRGVRRSMQMSQSEPDGREDESSHEEIDQLR